MHIFIFVKYKSVQMNPFLYTFMNYFMLDPKHIKYK